MTVHPRGRRKPHACEALSQILVYALAPGTQPAAARCTSTRDFLVYCSTNYLGLVVDLGAMPSKLRALAAHLVQHHQSTSSAVWPTTSSLSPCNQAPLVSLRCRLNATPQPVYIHIETKRFQQPWG
jgi:hypothetical protein